MHRKTLTGAVLAASSAALLAAVPAAQAAGPNTCIYNPATKNVVVKLVSGGYMELERDGDKLVTFDAFGRTECASTSGVKATVTNTAAVFMNGSISVKDDFIISHAQGTFGTGAPGGADPSRLEINVFSDSTDLVDVVGTDTTDLIAISGGQGTGKLGGVGLNTDAYLGIPSIRFTFANPSVLRVNGLAGGDFITAAGLYGPATTMHLELTGGDGDDTLHGGLIGGDRLSGGAGNDAFDTHEGQAGDIVSGGLGVDRARIDVNDFATGVETYVK